MKEKLDKLEKFIEKTKVVDDVGNKLGTYSNAVLICIDAVLSINRQYYKFVVPRIIYFQEKYSYINTLNKLIEVIEQENIIGFSKYWNYKHDQRALTLYELTKKLIDITNEYKELDELSALKKWATEVSPLDYKQFNVNGIGLATFQYIRMMLGAKTVKPDVHIKKIITEILNEKINDAQIITLFEKACDDLELDISVVEHSLWLQSAKGYSEFDKEWDGEKWIKKR